MTQTLIGQRLKILIETLELDVRTFSQRIDVAETTTRNYLNRGTKPGTEYLEKLSNSFSEANLHWLITGQGEPFLPNSTPSSDSHNLSAKNFQGNIAGTNHGNMTQSVGSPATLPDCLKELDANKREIELLKQQLQMAQALIDSKDETLALLRASYNRPN